MKQENLQTIREACANSAPGLSVFADIRLADVLLAIGKHHAGIAVSWCGEFLENQPMDGYRNDDTYPWRFKKVFWNLRKDDLIEQSDECIEFIANRLTI